MEKGNKSNHRRILKERLTPREQEVYWTVVNNASLYNDDLARMLYIVEKTLRLHLGNIYVKLGCRDRATLLNFHLAMIKGELEKLDLRLDEFCNIIPVERNTITKDESIDWGADGLPQGV